MSDERIYRKTTHPLPNAYYVLIEYVYVPEIRHKTVTDKLVSMSMSVMTPTKKVLETVTARDNFSNMRELFLSVAERKYQKRSAAQHKNNSINLWK